MRYLICYDISDTKVRNRVVKYLESFSYRLQYSVFLAVRLPMPLVELVKTLKTMVRRSERRNLLILPLCDGCWGKAVYYGIPLEKERSCVYL